MPSTGVLRALLVLGLVMVLAVSVPLTAQVIFRYHSRGDYWEGVCNEQPIAGIDLRLVSVCAETGDQATGATADVPEHLHLAFQVPDDADRVDITIHGPGNYLLDRVTREFHEGFNVFTWDSRVVKGLRIGLEVLEPLVSVGAGIHVPSFLCERRPTKMPQVANYRVGLMANTEGRVEYYAQDAEERVAEGTFEVSPNMAVELRLPAPAVSDHVDLFVRLEYGIPPLTHSVTQRFSIMSLRREPTTAEGH